MSKELKGNPVIVESGKMYFEARVNADEKEVRLWAHKGKERLYGNEIPIEDFDKIVNMFLTLRVKYREEFGK